MPVETEDQKRDAAKLIFLIFHFDKIITEIIKDTSLFKNKYIHSLISDAWQNELSEKVSALGKILYGGQHYEALKAAGLTGKQLDLKFTTLSFFLYNGASEVDLLSKDASRFRAPSKLPSLTKRIIAGFFDFFNSLLGSLSDAIPMAESLKEFKDMVHFEMEYGDINTQGTRS